MINFAQVNSSPMMKPHSLLEHIGLLQYYPKKLTIRDAVQIREDTLNVIDTTKDSMLYPFVILQKIMAFDSECRIPFNKYSDRATKQMEVLIQSLIQNQTKVKMVIQSIQWMAFWLSYIAVIIFFVKIYLVEWPLVKLLCLFFSQTLTQENSQFPYGQ